MAVNPLDRLKQRGLLQNTQLGYWARSPIPSSTTNFLYVNYNDKEELSYKGEKEMTAEEVTRYERSKIRAYLNLNPGFDALLTYYNQHKEEFNTMIKENEEMSNLTENTNTRTQSAFAEKFSWKPTRIGCISSSQKMYAVEMNKTKMIIEDDGVKFAYNPDMPVALASDVVIPRIEDVQSINNKVVIVKFADGTSEKAVLSENDTFSLEQGVSICITKKILNKVLKGANGTSAYNKLVDYGLKVYDKKQKEIKEAIAAKKAEKEAEQKKIDRIRKKRAKRKAKLREEQIEIRAEAYRRAMKSE